MLWGHTSIAPTSTLRRSNPPSDACLIAMDYGRETQIKGDWKKIFEPEQLDLVIKRMLKIDPIRC